MEQKNILNVRSVAGTKIDLSSYTHIVAYHASREEGENSFRKRGINSYTKEEALAAAIRKLESERISRDRIEAEFEPLWNDMHSPSGTRVWLMLEPTELMTDSGHYLIYGSEFLNALAMRLGCRDKLSKIGKPMIIKCEIPIHIISPFWLDGLEQDIQCRSTDDRAIAVETVAPEWIVEFQYPTGYIRDPYSWRMVKLG